MGNYHARFYEGLGRGDTPSLLSAGNISQFTYDGLGHFVMIIENSGGTITSTKQFVWGPNAIAEARDTTGALVAQYFQNGQAISGSSYFITRDNSWSVRELSNSSGIIQTGYAYNPFGQVTKIQGSSSSDFQYDGYYFHAPSALSLSVNRAYKSSYGRWINRDPIGERANINLFGYVRNEPIGHIDPTGLVTMIGPGYAYDPTQNNCMGYGCGTGYLVTPISGQPFSGFIPSLPGNVRCNRLPVCACAPGRFPFVLTLYGSNNNPVVGDPWDSTSDLPFHVIVPFPGGGYTRVSGDVPVGTQPDWRPTAPINTGVPSWTYCCCSDNPPNPGLPATCPRK